MNIIENIEREQLRDDIPAFKAGDTVKVHFKVVEGSRHRIQVFQGTVIKRQGEGVRETFTVRKQSFGVGVERTFPLHSPKIEKLEVAARGDVRRAKLYYLRDRVGKAARVAERRWGIGEEALGTEEDAAVDAEGATQTEAPQAVPAEGEDEGTVRELEQAPEAEPAAGGAEAAQDDADAGGDEADAIAKDEAGVEGEGEEEPPAAASESGPEPEGETAGSDEGADADAEASRQDA